MGAQESALLRKNSSDQNAIELGEEFPKSSGVYRVWTHVHPCMKRSKKGTIFTKEFANNQATKLNYENGVKLLKQLKHPSILSYVESSFNLSNMYLVTESVRVLDACIETQCAAEIQCGLKNILEALVFLHCKAGIVHQNINPSTIFVTPRGEWKLGGLEFAELVEKVNSANKSDIYLSAVDMKMKNQQFLPNDVYGRDAAGFSYLIDYALQYIPEEGYDEEAIRRLREVSASLSHKPDEITKREELCSWLDSPAFSNQLTVITEFLQTIQLKQQYEKEPFFELLPSRLRSLPSEVLARRLCRLLLSRYVLLQPLSHHYLYPYLLQPTVEGEEDAQGLLPLPLFTTHLIPELLRVFRVRDTSVRLALLTHFPLFVTYIPLHILDEFILDEILLGAHDTDDRLVSLSLAAMAALVPLLGASRVCKWKMTRSFVDGSPRSGPSSTIGSPIMPIASVSTSSSVSKSVISLSVVPPSSSNTFCSTNICKTTGDLFISAGKNQTHKEKMLVDEWNDDVDDWSADWETKQDEEFEEPTAGIEESVVSAASKITDNVIKEHDVLSISAKAAPSKIVDNTTKKKLGSEFDIPSVTSIQEEDFFADMAPQIKTAGSLIDQLMAMKVVQEEKSEVAVSLEKSKEVMMTKCTNLFKMAEVVEEETCWDDDAEFQIDDDEVPIPNQEKENIELKFGSEPKIDNVMLKEVDVLASPLDKLQNGYITGVGGEQKLDIETD